MPFHKNNKKEAGETDEESKKADDAGKEALEVEVSKQEYSRAVSITDSKKDHANMFTDKEHEKKNDEENPNLEKDAHISNIPRAKKQSNDAYVGITSTMNIAKIGNKDLSPKIPKDNKAENSQASKNLSNTTKAKDYKDANKGDTEDSIEENPNPPSIYSITTIKLEVEDNNFVKANEKKDFKEYR